MRHPIYQIMGTHGSGKSTLVKQVMAKGDAEAIINPEYSKSRPQLYRVTGLLKRKPLFVLGPYVSACGGCDALNGPVNVVPLLQRYYTQGPVLFEGAIISSFGRIGQWGEGELGDKHHFLFLDTTLEECKRRVNKRRLAAGKGPLENTDNITNRWCAMRTLYRSLEFKGYNVRWLHSRNALNELLELMGAA